MTDEHKETVAFDIRRFVVGLEKVYLDEPESLNREQRILKAVELLKTWASIYRDLESEKPFRPAFAVIDALQEDQFDRGG